MDPAPFYWEAGSNLWLRLHIQPRASRDGLCGRHGNALKIRITAPPLEGRANDHLIRLLSKMLNLKAGQITLSGEHSRDKTVCLADLSEPERERVLDWCQRQA